MPTEPRARLAHRLLLAVPPERHEIARGMLAEACALPSGPERRRWLFSACLYALKEGRTTWLRLAVSGFSTLFILWIAYNAIDSGFTGTGPEIASSLGLVVLLAATIALVTPLKQLRAVLRPDSRLPEKPQTRS